MRKTSWQRRQEMSGKKTGNVREKIVFTIEDTCFIIITCETDDGICQMSGISFFTGKKQKL